MLNKMMLTIAITGTVLIGGCNTMPKAVMQQQNLALLQNKNWTLTQIGATEYTAKTPVPTLQFDQATQRVSGTNGCNRIMGTYAIRNHQLSFGPLGSTRMHCPDQAQLTTQFNDAMAKVAGFQVFGHTLKLLDRHGNPVLQFTTENAQ